MKKHHSLLITVRVVTTPGPLSKQALAALERFHAGQQGCPVTGGSPQASGDGIIDTASHTTITERPNAKES